MKETTRGYIEQFNMFQLLTKQADGSRYVDCLEELQEKMQNNINGIPLEIAQNILETVYIARGTGDTTKTARQLAVETLRKLIQSHFLIEVYFNQESYVAFTPDGIKVTNLLKELDVQVEKEYVSDLSAILSIIGDTKAYDKPYTNVILQVREKTSELVMNLQGLSAEIKQRIVDDTSDCSLEELYARVLNAHSEYGPFAKFNRLYRETYARNIKTIIPDCLREIQNNENTMEKAVSDYAIVNKCDEETAKRQLRIEISNLISEYERDDRYFGILEHINKMISKYYDRAERQAKMASSSEGEGTRDKLKYILGHLENESDSECLGDLLNIYSVKNFNPMAYTLRNTSSDKPRRTGSPLPTKEERSAMANEVIEKLNKDNFVQVNEKINELLGNRNQLTDEDIPICSDEDAKLITAAFVNASHPSRCYDIKRLPGKHKTAYAEHDKYLLTRRKG